MTPAMPFGKPDSRIHAAALADLPNISAARLSRLLAGSDPVTVWQRVKEGQFSEEMADPETRSAWIRYVNDVSLETVAESLKANNVFVHLDTDDDFPERLRDDIDPLPVLFRKGRPLEASPVAPVITDDDTLELTPAITPSVITPSVTIVGTRRCSPTGRSFAFELGAELAQAGVRVVSGLALGIDGAAHRGALSGNENAEFANVVGVVGSGLDFIYPRANTDLWNAVAERGTLLSEAPMGGRALAWRFPARNRILAALADVVVVVESKKGGGSMHTVTEAMRRGVNVMAVPGSVRNAAAEGTNLLVSEGCAPVCCIDDVFVALGLVNEPRIRSAAAKARQPKKGLTGRILDEVDDNGATVDQLVLRLDTSTAKVLAGIGELEAQGDVSLVDGKVTRVN